MILVHEYYGTYLHKKYEIIVWWTQSACIFKWNLFHLYMYVREQDKTIFEKNNEKNYRINKKKIWRKGGSKILDIPWTNCIKNYSKNNKKVTLKRKKNKHDI